MISTNATSLPSAATFQATPETLAYRKTQTLLAAMELRNRLSTAAAPSDETAPTAEAPSPGQSEDYTPLDVYA